MAEEQYQLYKRLVNNQPTFYYAYGTQHDPGSTLATVDEAKAWYSRPAGVYTAGSTTPYQSGEVPGVRAAVDTTGWTQQQFETLWNQVGNRPNASYYAGGDTGWQNWLNQQLGAGTTYRTAYEKALAGQQVGTGTVSSWVAPWGETLTSVPQSQIDEIMKNEASVKAGTMKMIQPGVYAPIGSPATTVTPTPQTQTLGAMTGGATPIAQPQSPATTPQTTPQAQAPQQNQTLAIKSGENLSTIVKNAGITPQQFLALNPQYKATGLSNDWQGLTGLVRPGQTYLLPPKAPTAVPSATGAAGTTGTGGTTGISGAGTAKTAGTTGMIGTGTPEAPAPETPSDFIALYQNTLKSLGIPELKTQLDKVQKDYADMQNELNDKINDLNNNPWMSQSVRDREATRLKARYEGKLGILVDQQKLYQAMRDEGILEAKFLTTGTIENELALAKLAQDKLEFEESLKEKAKSYANYKEVQGGLYDINTNKWIIPPKAGTGGADDLTIAQRNSTINAIVGAFDNEQIVKDYNSTVNKYNTVQAIINKGVGGPGDLAIVYEFMKGLDPSSVVRETEYATAAKSGNIFAGALAKYNGYFKEEGGFLPENVKNSFKSILQTKLDVAKSQYDNLYNEYQRRVQNVQAGGYNTLPQYNMEKNLTDDQAYELYLQQKTKSGYVGPYAPKYYTK